MFVATMYHLTFWSRAFPAGQVTLASKGVADFHDSPLITFAGYGASPCRNPLTASIARRIHISVACDAS